MAIDLQRIQDSPHLLDILIQCEDVLDSMDIYVFKNWLDGEVVEGPVVRRYWLNFTLKYPYNKMPDPRAALRLMKHGVRVDFEKARYDTRKPGANMPTPKGDEDDKEGLAWLVKISIPRRLVVQMADAEHDFYDEEVDIDQVEDAKDAGMDDESGFTEQGQQGQEGIEGSQDQVGGPGGEQE